jgi:hypothetical protein
MDNDETNTIEIPHSDIVERIGIVGPPVHALESPVQKAKLLNEATKRFQDEWRNITPSSDGDDCPPPDCKSD